eukprot:COSAG01_NODE_1479_length_10161_cov_138.934109_1_plen_65_part_10
MAGSRQTGRLKKALRLPPVEPAGSRCPECLFGGTSPPGISPGLLAAAPPRPAGVRTQPTRPSATR